MKKKGLDLECDNNDTFYYICKYGTPKIINRFLDIYIEKGFDLECQDKWKPIHYICIDGSTQLINKILDIYLDKGFNLQCKNIPLHYICRYGKLELIKRIINIYIEKNLDIHLKTYNEDDYLSFLKLNVNDINTILHHLET